MRFKILFLLIKRESKLSRAHKYYKLKFFLCQQFFFLFSTVCTSLIEMAFNQVKKNNCSYILGSLKF